MSFIESILILYGSRYNTKESVGVPKPVVTVRSISSTAPCTGLGRGTSSTSLRLGDRLFNMANTSTLLHEDSVELTALRAAGTGLGDGAHLCQEKVALGHSAEPKEEDDAFAAKGKTHVGVTAPCFLFIFWQELFSQPLDVILLGSFLKLH